MMRGLMGVAATAAMAAATSSREIGATRPCPVGSTSSPDVWLGTSQCLRIKSEYRPHLRMVEGTPQTTRGTLLTLGSLATSAAEAWCVLRDAPVGRSSG